MEPRFGYYVFYKYDGNIGFCCQMILFFENYEKDERSRMRGETTQRNALGITLLKMFKPRRRQITEKSGQTDRLII